MRNPAKPSSAQLRLPSVQELEVARGEFVSSETYRAGITTAPRVLDVLDALTESRRAVDERDFSKAIEWLGMAYDVTAGFTGLAGVCDVAQFARQCYSNFVGALVKEHRDIMRREGVLHRVQGYVDPFSHLERA